MELKETKLAIVLLDLIGSTQFVQKVGAMKAALNGCSITTDWLDH